MRCEECGSKHEPWQPHKELNNVRVIPEPKEEPETDGEGESRGLSKDDVRLLERTRKARWREANRQKYNDYQRQYMRRYRA